MFKRRYRGSDVLVHINTIQTCLPFLQPSGTKQTGTKDETPQTQTSLLSPDTIKQ